MSLRDELMSKPAPVPAYALLLPSGWAALEPTRATFHDLTLKASARFRAAGRPDLDAQFRTLMETSTRQLLSRDPVKVYLQRDVPEDRVLPISITAARVSGPDGGSLDQWVSTLVNTKGAKPFADGILLRWVGESVQKVQGTPVTLRSVDYLIPLPDTGRRQGLLFTTVIPLGSAPRLDEELIAGLTLLSDSILATFRWEPRP